MNINEKKRWERVKKYFKEKNETFKEISKNDQGKNRRHCVKSKEKAINGDKLKLDCWSYCSQNKSVDAISVNSNFKICLIEFKVKNIKQTDKSKLIKELREKFKNSTICFCHKFDDEKEINSNLFEEYCVIKVADKQSSWSNFRSIKSKKSKKDKFEIFSAFDFEQRISDFKMHDFFIN